MQRDAVADPVPKRDVTPAKKRSTVVCSKCGTPGHNARTCRGGPGGGVERGEVDRPAPNHDRRELIAAHVAKSQQPRAVSGGTVAPELGGVGSPRDDAPMPTDVAPEIDASDWPAFVEANPLIIVGEGGSCRRSKDRPRHVTIAPARMTRAEARAANAELAAELAEIDQLRPKTRAECRPGIGVRPCPFVSCRFHLAIDVNPETGSLTLNRPELEVWELPESCALDVAERGEQTREVIGDILNVTRERLRQLEVEALAEMEAKKALLERPDERGGEDVAA
ncbi:MAG: hypothetical protein QOI20_3245 [Acidimicrobiaceae bacterium]|nr:hypothetical protein [Acidimicrobiaceae bacterium]